MSDRTFRGTNQLDVLNAYSARKFYADQAISSDIEGIRDFWFAETLLYGRMDEKQNVIALNTSNLKQISSNSDKHIFAVSFVADAFGDLKKFFKKAANIGQISKDSKFLSDLNPQKGYLDPQIDYNKYVIQFFTDFGENLKNNEVSNTILTFEDYLNYLLRYLSETPEPILSKTKFIGSNKTNVLHSGLALEIADLDSSNDQTKTDSIIDDLTFEFYCNACVNFGFMVDKNSPWRIVADIGASAMAPYMSANSTSSDKVLSSVYSLVHYSDLDELKPTILRFYNAFAASRPVFKKTLGYDGKRIKQGIFTRSEETLETIDQHYGAAIWLNFLVTLRNVENLRKYNKYQLKIINSQFHDLYEKDQIKAFEFLNNKFVGFERFAGSLQSRLMNVEHS